MKHSSFQKNMCADPEKGIQNLVARWDKWIRVGRLCWEI